MGRAVLNPVLMDTHVLVWLLEGDDNLGKQARQLIETAAREDALLVSAITFWEVAMLARRGRLFLAESVASWRQKVLGLGVVEIPVSGDIGIRAAELEDFQPDPADRIIATTAAAQGARLITADTAILRWRSPLVRQDARN